MALQPWRQGIVTRIEQETYNTRRFWIRVPDVESFDFTPGQFVTLDLPIHEKINKRVRSYSIASWPDGTNCRTILDRKCGTACTGFSRKDWYYDIVRLFEWTHLLAAPVEVIRRVTTAFRPGSYKLAKQSLSKNNRQSPPGDRCIRGGG